MSPEIKALPSLAISRSPSVVDCNSGHVFSLSSSGVGTLNISDRSPSWYTCSADAVSQINTGNSRELYT